MSVSQIVSLFVFLLHFSLRCSQESWSDRYPAHKNGPRSHRSESRDHHHSHHQHHHHHQHHQRRDSESDFRKMLSPSSPPPKISSSKFSHGGSAATTTSSTIAAAEAAAAAGSTTESRDFSFSAASIDETYLTKSYVSHQHPQSAPPHPPPPHLRQQHFVRTKTLSEDGSPAISAEIWEPPRTVLLHRDPTGPSLGISIVGE